MKKAIGIIHLWLGLLSGPVVCFLGITGCILAFQREIETVTHGYQYVQPQQAERLPPSKIYTIAEKALPGKPPHSVLYSAKNKAAMVIYYADSPKYYYNVFIDPYNGKVLKVKDMNTDFFRVVIDGHFYLWLPPKIGKPVIATATLIFVVMMITGLVLWWPRNKASRKQRFGIKWNARWRRVNYDLHSVVGFYAIFGAIFIALTGLVWGFEWVGGAVYWVASGGKQPAAWYETVSKKTTVKQHEGMPVIDKVWHFMNREYPRSEVIEIHYPGNDSMAIEGVANPDETTYWKSDYRYFDQHSGAEMQVKHMYGRLSNTTVADKIARMNYDIHVGAALGLPGKIMAFSFSLFVASLPVTGFLLWRGRRKSKKHNYSRIK